MADKINNSRMIGTRFLFGCPGLKDAAWPRRRKIEKQLRRSEIFIATVIVEGD